MDRIKQFEPLFGEWYVESFIGAGSFGRVYKIYRDELGNRFYSALKYISIPAEDADIRELRSSGMNDDSISTYYTSAVRDVAAETALMHELRGNTNIVGFEDSRVLQKQNGIGYDIFIRMELLESLTDRMKAAMPTKAEAVTIGIDICKALSICAKQGIIHRDVKPDNILISKHGDYKLGDFGISRHLENTVGAMSKKGTESYMAPEVYKGEGYGHSCDTYSLGLVMYRLLNGGRLPFLPPAFLAKDKETALIRRMRGDALDAPCNADEELSRIVLKACAFKPEDRYASPDEMREDLTDYLRHMHQINEVQDEESEPSPVEREDPTEPTSGTEGTQSILDNEKPVDDPKEKTVGIFYPNGEARRPGGINRQEPITTGGSKRKKGIIIGIASALCLVAGFIALALTGVFGKNDKGGNKQSIATSEPTFTAPTPAPTPKPTPKPTHAPKPAPDRGQVVEFSDSIFNMAFRKNYDFLGKKIYESDILAITELDLSGQGLQDISDVAKFKNLTILELRDNAIMDINAVGSLKKLIRLNLNNNSIREISCLKQLSSLSQLYLWKNKIDDFSSIHGLTGLNKLNIAYQYIDDFSTINDISWLGRFTNLTWLNISGTGIKNISVLSGLAKLESLYMCNNSIYDISPLANLANLKALSFSYNEAAYDAGPIERLTNLEYLYLKADEYSAVWNRDELKYFYNLSKLKLLDLSGNKYYDWMSADKHLRSEDIDELEVHLPNCEVIWP